jgi:pimeloyl-ACP methyl ester carboxylesterase
MTPLLLLPGLLCDAAVWLAQMTGLGRSCTVVDYGQASSLAAMAEIALAAAPAGCFAVAGHSMGGRVAFELQRLVPQRIERLALLDTGCQPLAPGAAGEVERAGRMALLELARRDGMRAMARRWARGMVHPSRFDGPVLEAVLDMFERHEPAIFEAQIEALLGRPDAGPQLAGIGVPTLLLCGADDAWSPPSQHRAMHEAIAGSRLVVVERCGHMSTMESPQAVNAALAEWLRV